MSKTSVGFLAWSNTIEIFGHGQQMLAPLTSLVGECGHTKQSKLLKVKKKPWIWTEEHQKAFDDVKATIAKDVSLAYPDYSKGFEIYTDGSKRQLGAVITQNNRPIAFFSRKLCLSAKIQRNEIELLAIVETLKEFKGMLWGIVVYTDHKNLMQDALGLTCDRVYRWRLLLEEYGHEIVYSKESTTQLRMQLTLVQQRTSRKTGYPSPNAGVITLCKQKRTHPQHNTQTS
eukprot:CCRYP_005413-RA/>CCRYP_005413-RA protein AED:0.08 eAED:0.27 QI:0/-1/0/1/-1/1/1/0/229